jgi:hypothetical protein
MAARASTGFAVRIDNSAAAAIGDLHQCVGER